MTGEDIYLCSHTNPTRVYPDHDCYGATLELDGIWRRRWNTLCWSCSLARWQANHPGEEYSHAQHYRDSEFEVTP